MEGFVLRSADLVVARGKFTHDLAVSQGVKPQSLFILPHYVRWINDAQVQPLPPRPTVLFVGRLEREKGVEVLLQAMAIVRKTLPDCHLLIAGDGSCRQSLEQLADSLGLRARESFLGWLEDESLQKAYKASWLLVLPSIVEDGFPTVLSEAGLMGRPVVGSNIGGIKDLIQHGENGLLVPPGNAPALARAVVILAKDPQLRARYSAAALTRVREFTVDRMVEKTEEVYRSIVRKPAETSTRT